MSNYISKSLYENEKDKGKKKLDHDFLCKVAKSHLQSIHIALPSVLTLFGVIAAFVLFLCIISPLDVFINASTAILVLAITIALIYRSLSKDYFSAYRTIINKEYTVITDTVYCFSERNIVRFHRHLSVTVQPIMLLSVCDPIDVHASDMEEIKSGDKLYIVVSNKNPKKAIFLFDAEHFELNENEV